MSVFKITIRLEKNSKLNARIMEKTRKFFQLHKKIKSATIDTKGGEENVNYIITLFSPNTETSEEISLEEVHDQLKKAASEIWCSLEGEHQYEVEKLK